jgi:hypothetical protein
VGVQSTHLLGVMADQLLNDCLRDSGVFEQADSGMTQ